MFRGLPVFSAECTKNYCLHHLLAQQWAIHSITSWHCNFLLGYLSGHQLFVLSYLLLVYINPLGHRLLGTPCDSLTILCVADCSGNQIEWQYYEYAWNQSRISHLTCNHFVSLKNSKMAALCISEHMLITPHWILEFVQTSSDMQQTNNTSISLLAL